MEKKEFITFLNELFKSYGFKKQGNNWINETGPLKKIINLQKSNFGNYYYINYSWNIKSIESKGVEHVTGRLASLNKSENQLIEELLDFNNIINDDRRRIELYNLIVLNLLEKIEAINTEEELLSELKKRTNLNNIPLVVKKYFGFNID